MNGPSKFRLSCPSNALRIFTLVLAIGLVSACVPLPFPAVDIPATKGQVVDAVSSQPVPSSIIVLTALDSDKTLRLRTNEKGEFQSARVWHWRLLLWKPLETDLAFQDASSFGAGLSVRARGYDPSYRRISGGSVIDLKALTLQPAFDDSAKARKHHGQGPRAFPRALRVSAASLRVL